MEVDPAVIDAKLTRRAEQDLSRESRLNVESNRVGAAAMRRLQITEFDQLVTHEFWVTFGYSEMTFTFHDLQLGTKFGAVNPRSIDNRACLNHFAILESYPTVRDLDDPDT